MAIQWDTYRDTHLRPLLIDELIAAYDWSDSELLLNINLALDIIGLQLPISATWDISTIVDTATYELPEDMVRLHIVELDGATLPEIVLRPGVTLDEDRVGYMQVGTTLKLFPTPDEVLTCSLYGSRLFEPIVNEADPLLVPRSVLPPLSYLVRAICVEKKELSAADLSQWARSSDKGGDRRDNPLTPVSNAYYKRYKELIDTLRSSNIYLFG